MMKLALLLLCLACIPFGIKAQDALSRLQLYLEKADQHKNANNYDSVIHYLNAAEKVLTENQLQQNPISPILYNQLGQLWSHQKNYSKSHQYFSLAWQYAHKTNSAFEAGLAYASLNNLHKEIALQNIAFDYPEVSEKEKTLVAFPVQQIAEAGDSLLLTIGAGKYDGIADSSQEAEIYTHYVNNDSSHHSAIQFITYGKIIALTNNYCLVKVPKSSTPILKNDITYLNALVPAHWRNMAMREQLINGIYFNNNYKEPIYSYRYYYYYADSSNEAQAFKLMQEAVKEAAEMFAEDTLTNAQFAQKIEQGIFKDKNIISGMLQSKPQHLQMFLHYVQQYYSKYVNNHFRFSEVYATWLLHQSPLVEKDVMAYLYPLADNSKLLSTETQKLLKQIQEDNLPDKWLDAGMQQVSLENLDDAQRSALLIKTAYTLLQDNYNSGWASYLQANIEKKKNQTGTANRLLTTALQQFEKSKNKEGIQWVNNTRQQWQQGAMIKTGIQNGNLFGFQLAQSYNPRFFATGGADNMVKIWDRNLGKEMLTLKHHTDEIYALQYSPNGRYLATAGADRKIFIYNAYNYGLIYSLQTKEPVRAMQFSPDGKLLAIACTDSIVRLLDYKKDSIVRTFAKHKSRVTDVSFHPQVSHWLYSAGTDSMLYRWNTKTGEMQRWYRLKGKVLSVKFNAEGKFMSTVSTDSVLTVWDLENNKKWGTYRIAVFMQGSNKHFASETFSPNNKYIAFPYTKDSFAVIRLRDGYERDYPTNMPYNYLADLQFSLDGQSLYARFNLAAGLRLYNFSGWDIQHHSVITYKDIRSFSNFLVGVEFSNDDNNITITHTGVSRVDLRSGKTSHLPGTYLTVQARRLFFNDQKRFISFFQYEPGFTIEDLNGNVSGMFKIPGNETLKAFDMSSDNHYAYLAGSNGSIYGWNISTGKPLFDHNFYPGSYAMALIVNNHTRQLMAIADSSVDIIDTTGHMVNRIAISEPAYAIAGKKMLFVSNNNGEVFTYDAATLKKTGSIRINKLNQAAYQLLLSPNEDVLYIQNGNNRLTAYQVHTGKVIYDIYDHDYAGTMIALNQSGTVLASAGFDSKIKLYKANSGKHIADIYLPQEREAIIINDSGYYLAQKSSLDALLFSYNNNAYTYEQFDAQFNRPHAILAQLGRADSTGIQLYKAAYQKRLSRLGIKEQPAMAALEIPLLRILNKSSIQTISNNSSFTLQIACTDLRYPIKYVQVLVNNTPMWQGQGFYFTDSALHQRKEITIPLSYGNNTIKVFCINSKGARSLSEQIQVMAKYETAPAKTYFIGIAVDQYKDSSMNLRYAAKDIRDLAHSFSNLYSNIEIDTLINRDATRENIIALHQKLMSSTVNDRVILAVTGHGLLSKSFDFYYATWDNEFSQPEKRGIPYNELEALLNGIPAREKLMLIDACHSGALDKEALLAQKISIETDSSSKINGVLPRGVIKLGGNKDVAAANTYDMMQKLFTDVSGNNGAFIISAAGGMEYALESARWNNGVFTYCVRKGIEEKAADKEVAGNFDGKVSVQELQQYVSKKVAELTGGKQQPTNRRENLDFEWYLRR